MAGMRGLTILSIVALACIAASPALAVTRGPDGRPRPDGYPDIPTMSYGPTPPCYLNSVAVTCEWYGFSHVDYPNQGADCLVNTRKTLANTTLEPPGVMKPYLYYYLRTYVFDTTTNTSYCLYGCFDMSASAPVASPPPGFAPPPVTVGTPPPTVFYPPPAALTPPPAADVTPPPPATLVPPPARVTPPPPTTLPPDSPLTPTPPGTSLPPPPPNGTRVINLNGAGFLRPTGFVSFIISGALLILNGLAAFQ